MILLICDGCGDEFAGARHEKFCPECAKFGVKIIASTKPAPPKVRKDEDVQDRLRRRKMNRPKRDVKKYAL